jgi:hypothetical protein
MDPNRGQEQKDFLAFLFPESSSEQQRGHDAQQNDIINAAAMHGQRSTSGMSHFSGTTNSPMFNQPIDLMSMSNLMSMQGMDTTPLPAPPNTTGFTPQVIFEQQYKLTQLHQLQQLQSQIQNQIFQQQVSYLVLCSTTLSGGAGTQTRGLNIHAEVPPLLACPYQWTVRPKYP